jgi:hypothetical protein
MKPLFHGYFGIFWSQAFPLASADFFLRIIYLPNKSSAIIHLNKMITFLLVALDGKS